MLFSEYYLYLKAGHVIVMTTWMAGLFYLPRLFVYHANAKGEETKKTLKTMEWKLLKFIMNPSFILTWVLGILLVYVTEVGSELWLNIKILLVLLMSGFHMYCARQVRLFSIDRNENTQKFFRLINEIPTILFILIVFLVVIKPSN
tara:strand:- start:185 stop:622 length:438 start_codon:yes stop_codon:yes gene_type:complete